MDEREEKKRCVACDTEKALRLFRCRTSPANGQIMVDNICLRCRNAADNARLKLALLDAFGCKCACCGETQPQFLTLEHIVPVGHRKQSKQCMTLLRDARRDKFDPTRYELLCMNCNAAKGFYGQCPHRLGLSPQEALERLRKVAAVKIGYGHRKTRGEFKPGPDARRTKGQFKDGHEYIGPKKNEQVVQ
jgi:hypothetical protein